MPNRAKNPEALSPMPGKSGADLKGQDGLI